MAAQERLCLKAKISLTDTRLSVSKWEVKSHPGFFRIHNGRNTLTLELLAPGAINNGTIQNSIRFAGQGIDDNNSLFDA